jgi:hypothetical protein
MNNFKNTPAIMLNPKISICVTSAFLDDSLLSLQSMYLLIKIIGKKI